MLTILVKSKERPLSLRETFMTINASYDSSWFESKIEKYIYQIKNIDSDFFLVFSTIDFYKFNTIGQTSSNNLSNTIRSFLNFKYENGKNEYVLNRDEMLDLFISIIYLFSFYKSSFLEYRRFLLDDGFMNFVIFKSMGIDYSMEKIRELDFSESHNTTESLMECEDFEKLFLSLHVQKIIYYKTLNYTISSFHRVCIENLNILLRMIYNFNYDLKDYICYKPFFDDENKKLRIEYTKKLKKAIDFLFYSMDKIIEISVNNFNCISEREINDLKSILNICDSRIIVDYEFYDKTENYIFNPHELVKQIKLMDLFYEREKNNKNYKKLNYMLNV